MEPSMTNRDHRQRAVLQWVGDTFGEANLSPKERVTRLLEEAIELAQAEGIEFDRILSVARFVYNKPAGDPIQEAGAVGVTLLAYCESRGIHADAAEQWEFDRVLAISPEQFRERHQRKADAGIAAPPAMESTT